MWEQLLPKEGSDQTVSQIVGPPSTFRTGIKSAAGIHTRKCWIGGTACEGVSPPTSASTARAQDLLLSSGL